MASYVFLYLLMMLTPADEQETKLKCADFKTGKFKQLDENKNEIPYSMERNDSLQVEYDEKTKATTTLQVVWTGECTYYLKYLEGQDNRNEEADGQNLMVEIIETKKNMYKYAAWFENSESIKVYGWVKKLD
ncbi:MAG TPA: hypothetical protein VEC12_10925 [Bacteroidia bacterium]|nr:hypothetical protein [Bacteroidia bacterium]